MPRQPSYVAPYNLTDGQDVLPAQGRFLIPLCITSDRLLLMLNALIKGGLEIGLRSFDDHNVDLIEALAFVQEPLNNPCFQVDDDVCITYPPDAGLIRWEPHNPFTQPDLTPPGYNFPPWAVAEPPVAGLPFVGLEPGDVFTYLPVFPIQTNYLELLSQGLPRFIITVQGEGVIELHLLNVPQGGIASITVDGNPLTNTIVELNRDLLSLPPETTDVVIVEKEIIGAGPHTVRVDFLPTVNDSAIPLFFGGGLRKIVLCGFEQQGLFIMPEFQLNGCNLEWRPSENSPWIDLGDVCAPTPQVRITPTLGGEGNNVEFDMDGDGQFDDGGFFVFNGQDGEDGEDGNSPVFQFSPTEDGTRIDVDADGDGVFDGGFDVVNGEDGECPDCSPQAPDSDLFNDTDFCAIANYNAESFITVMYAALRELVYAGSFLQWYELLNVSIEAAIQESIANPITEAATGEEWRTLYDLLASYQQQEIDIVLAELPFLRTANRDEIFCSRNITRSALLAASFATPTFQVETQDVFFAALEAVGDDLWNSWSNYALQFNRDVDCSSIDCNLGLQGLFVANFEATLQVPVAFTSINNPPPSPPEVDVNYGGLYLQQGNAIVSSQRPDSDPAVVELSIGFTFPQIPVGETWNIKLIFEFDRAVSVQMRRGVEGIPPVINTGSVQGAYRRVSSARKPCFLLSIGTALFTCAQQPAMTAGVTCTQSHHCAV